ncbi:transporter substrate-binding domain-containing protein [uncultured Paraglaciecola sp.]|uniref:substrate-binding periplasmic protein n=1 Tax=uncultured Paraglaciecola sp. TaxID=1765024 RepID=UPI0030D976E5|tara:strand:- start:10975 stop:11736 length:762 start_codon:yes stop_codon:yes gene_type:complete
MFKWLLLCFIFCGFSAQLVAKTPPQTTTLKVGVPGFAPFAYVNNKNELTGSVVRYLDLLSVKTGIKFDIVLWPYARVISGVQRGTLDGAVIFRNAQLNDYVTFIGPISKSRVIVLPQMGRNLSTYNQLLLLNHIAVIRGASFSRTFDEDTQLRKLQVSDYAQGLNLLRLNRVNAVVGSLQGIEYNLIALGENIQDFGTPLVLAENSNWFHFSKKSLHQNVIPDLTKAIEALYQPDLLYKLYKLPESPSSMDND